MELSTNQCLQVGVGVGPRVGAVVGVGYEIARGANERGACSCFFRPKNCPLSSILFLTLYFLCLLTSKASQVSAWALNLSSSSLVTAMSCSS